MNPQDAYPEFWDAIVNGVGDVWKDKRPAYRSKTRETVSEASGTTAFSTTDFQATSGSDSLTLDEPPEPTLDGDVSTPSSTALPLWLSVDDTEHASGFHGGTAEYIGDCSQLPGNLQRCRVTIDKFVAFDAGVLEYITPLFTHFGTKDLKTENRTGPTGTTVACAAATGVAFSVCLIGTSCGATASVSLSVLIASASSTVTGGNLWRDSNAEHFTCNLAARRAVTALHRVSTAPAR